MKAVTESEAKQGNRKCPYLGGCIDLVNEFADVVCVIEPWF